jgi:hypothetical protein
MSFAPKQVDAGMEAALFNLRNGQTAGEDMYCCIMDEDVVRIGSLRLNKPFLLRGAIVLIAGALILFCLRGWINLGLEQYYSSNQSAPVRIAE